MQGLVRPLVMVVACAALLGALILVLGPTWTAAPANQAIPRPVPEGDQEVVWLNAATNAVAWERFVAAIKRLQENQEFGLEIVDDANAFPTHTTVVPELAVTRKGSKGRLWFRWYKMTGELGTAPWVEALAKRTPAPLAIIGGGSSDRARDLAKELSDQRARFAMPPLFLITTATADQVDLDVDLMKVYDQRSFRFCFTNRQMAEAMADFVWSQDDLRPDAEPIYLIRWSDDPYSNDLFNRFRDTLFRGGYVERLQHKQAVQAATRDWAWLAGYLTVGGIPPGLDFEGLRRLDFEPPLPFWSVAIPYSLGTFNQPNFPETEAADKLLDELSRHPEQRRPLLIMPANPNPARRFLRALVRTAPVEAGQFVVATGDAIDFNVIYRDRRLTWPIQDLPVPFLFFCHRDPVDPIAFAEDQPGKETAAPDPTGRTSTGTHDLLLYVDIVETLAGVAFEGGTLVASADNLRARLRTLQGKDGRPRFDDDGNQTSGTGEYIVCLLPVRVGAAGATRVRPQAIVQVWNGSTDAGGKRTWRLQRKIVVDYSLAPPVATMGAQP